MHESIKYINHINEAIEIGNGPYYANENDIRDYSMTYTASNGQITNFKRAVKEKKLPLIIMGSGKDKNRLYDVFQTDIDAEIPGVLHIGEYSLKCYVVGCENSDYINNDVLYKTLRIIPVDAVWSKEVTVNFTNEILADTGEEDFPCDYEYDYKADVTVNAIENSFGAPCGFKIIIYGPCENPSIIIGGNIYKINYSISGNQYAMITSSGSQKTVILTKNDGEKVNLFQYREKSNSIFQKIPKGISTVTWDGTFKFDVVLLDERGEPEWN